MARVFQHVWFGKPVSCATFEDVMKVKKSLLSQEKRLGFGLLKTDEVSVSLALLFWATLTTSLIVLLTGGRVLILGIRVRGWKYSGIKWLSFGFLVERVHQSQLKFCVLKDFANSFYRSKIGIWVKLAGDKIFSGSPSSIVEISTTLNSPRCSYETAIPFGGISATEESRAEVPSVETSIDRIEDDSLYEELNLWYCLFKVGSSLTNPNTSHSQCFTSQSVWAISRCRWILL